MDPVQTLKDFLDAVAENDIDRAIDFAAYLIELINKGGFVPTVSGAQLSQMVSRIACDMEYHRLRK